MRTSTSMLVSVAVFALAGAAQAVTFSVAPGAVGGPGAACILGSDDVCFSAGGGANVTWAPAGSFGLGLLGPGDDIDALSLNFAFPPPPFPALGPGFPIRFSVAPGSVGAGLPAGTLPGDVLTSTGGGTSSLVFTSAALGLAAADDLNALDEKAVALGGGVFFSLAPGSPSLGAFTPGDIFLSLGGGLFGLFINAESLGLCTIRSGCLADDDLDALIVNTDAWVGVGLLPPTLQTGLGLLFSVAPGATGAGLPAGTLPGDILASTGGGFSALWAGAAALGLAAGDNLDALSMIPEPSTGLLLASGLLALAAARRRRASP